MFGWLGIGIGILLIVLGGWLVFFFPSTVEHQPEQFGWTAIVLGIVLIIIGGLFVFL